MSSISVIGLGGMARAIGARAVEGGNAVEVMGRDAAKARDLVGALGGGAMAGTSGAAPAGKVIIDITNPISADAAGLVTPDGTSAAQEIAKAAPASAHVVKAFNTVFGHVLAQGRPLDVLFAGDGARAKASHARVRRGTRGNRKAAGCGGEHWLVREAGPAGHRGGAGPSRRR